MGSVQSSPPRTGSAGLTEPEPTAPTVTKNSREKPRSCDCCKIFYGRTPRGSTIRKYPRGETQELAPTTVKVKVKVKVESNLVPKTLPQMLQTTSRSHLGVLLLCFRSRSEQAPGSEFHPRDESEKIDCGFLGPSWCNKKVNH